ncbi:MAG: 4Fe-4S dicluster domain-containing protein [Candidatus Lokiarchaeota archaeon]|nr:4Fe-4S dicluster domain-containing protein [Candidatus Lokiarchaeota archaeon]
MGLSIDFDFRKKLQSHNFSLNYCFQCATCSGGCPIARLTNGSYNPRKIIEESILGLKDRLIEKQEPNVWLCSTCQKCVELCPQHVELTEIFNVLKNAAVKAGKCPEAFKSQGISVLENGVAVPFTTPINRRREQLGLPIIEISALREIQTLLKEVGFDKIIHYNWNNVE